MLVAIVVLAIIAFAMPWTFRYLLIAPFLGTGLGGLSWGISVLVGADVVSLGAFGAFIASGTVLAGLLIRRFDL